MPRPEVLAQAPEGTYSMLEDLVGEEDLVWLGSSYHSVEIFVSPERVCKETGGACMDLSIRQRQRTGPSFHHHAHITRNDEVVQLNSYTNSTGGQRTEIDSPKIEELVETFQRNRNRLPRQH